MRSSTGGSRCPVRGSWAGARPRTRASHSVARRRTYDGWATLGNPGWGFADVLDDFRRLESDQDFADEWHGSDGLIPIRRYPRERDEPRPGGIPRRSDCVGSSVRRGPQSPRRGRSRTDPSKRPRRNANEYRGHVPRSGTIATGTSRFGPTPMVARVECSGTRATGIRLLDGTIIEADRVVLSAGTYASPTILARSGIGPAAELRALDITPVRGPARGRIESRRPPIGLRRPADSAVVRPRVDFKPT